MPEKFEASISTLEDTKDLTQITLVEILNALQAHEQIRAMRQEGGAEGALPTKHHENARNNNRKKFFKRKQNPNMENPPTTRQEARRGPTLHVNIAIERIILLSNVGENQTPSAPNVTKWDMKL